MQVSCIRTFQSEQRTRRRELARIVLALAVVLPVVTAHAVATGVEEVWNRTIPTVCWSLSVSNEGDVAAVEVDGSQTTLGVYSADGTIIKRWTPPRGKQFTYCAVDDARILALYGDVASLFTDRGREQAWSKSVADMWPTTAALNASIGYVVFADQPLVLQSTVWCLTLKGDRIWSKSVPSLVTDTAISDSGHVVVAGEMYGLMYDQGMHAVYLFSPSGTELWRVETESPVIDVDISPQAQYVVAGLDNGGMLLLDETGRTVWSRNDIGGWIDMAADANVIIASTNFDGIAALALSGETLWRNPDARLWGDRDGLCVSENGSIVVALGFEMIYPDNVVQILNSMGEVLYEQENSSTAPRVAVSPNGRYVAIAFGRWLRLFEASW